MKPSPVMSPVNSSATITLRDLVAQHARRAPQSVALVSDGATLTYGELDARASQLARDLAGAGVTKGARVAFYLDRALEIVVALLGIMEAGAVSIPVGIQQPTSRVKTILENAKPCLLITDQGIEHQINSSQLELADEPACILYRSGTGIKTSHAALTRSSLTSSDRIAQPIDVMRDASFLALVNAIAAGACVIDTSAARELSPRKFALFLNDNEATVWLASAADQQRIGGEFSNQLKKLRLTLSDDPVEQVDLKEIEAALLRHPAVRAAEVELTDSELVAIVTPQVGQLPEPRELREFLQEHLPAAMIPRIVVDPQTGTEEELTRIWQHVLKKEQVGTSDNFFDLGGHSMALVQVGALIKQRLGQKVSLPVLLSCPTIHSLASHLDHARTANG